MTSIYSICKTHQKSLKLIKTDQHWTNSLICSIQINTHNIFKRHQSQSICVNFYKRLNKSSKVIKMNQNLKEFLDNQKDLRDRLVQYMRKTDTPVLPLSRIIKMSFNTLHKFLLREEDLSLKSLFKIQAFLERESAHSRGV